MRPRMKQSRQVARVRHDLLNAASDETCFRIASTTLGRHMYLVAGKQIGTCCIVRSPRCWPNLEMFLRKVAMDLEIYAHLVHVDIVVETCLCLWIGCVVDPARVVVQSLIDRS